MSPPRKIFVEGGGDHNDALRSECRRAFKKLLEKAGFKGRLPQAIPCGGRRNAYEQFCTAIDGGEISSILLVDSEAPVVTDDPWQHVAQRPGDGWRKPDGATAAHLHLMVQCMEAWFLADRRALREYFGQGLQETALPAETLGPEDVRKRDLFSKLKQATRRVKTKGAYDKGRHSFKLLERLDPDLVRKTCPWAERFFVTLDRWTR